MHVGGAKRKAPVRCAAANDDEDLGGAVDAKEHSSGGGRGGGAASSSAADAGGKKRKKAKEFAWMDSEDEDDDQAADNGEEEPEKSENAGGDDEQEEFSLEALEKVQTFGRMMLLAPSVRGKLRGGALGPTEVAATCRALTRAKFFDRELLDDLYAALKTMLAEAKLGPVETCDAMKCMVTLNAYDTETFAAIAKSYMARTAELDATARAYWSEAFVKFGHKSEPAFMQLLEVPPVPVLHPNYKRVRCWHYSKGSCILGEAVCTYSHDPRAPLSLADGTKEDWWKNKGNLMMTQNQKYMGNGSYGTGPLGVNPM